jgi:hypothetical protein
MRSEHTEHDPRNSVQVAHKPAVVSRRVNLGSIGRGARSNTYVARDCWARQGQTCPGKHAAEQYWEPTGDVVSAAKALWVGREISAMRGRVSKDGAARDSAVRTWASQDARARARVAARAAGVTATGATEMDDGPSVSDTDRGGGGRRSRLRGGAVTQETRHSLWQI